ncbi:MAG: PAS domain-containing protein [Janthinobacterium lividum]
MLASIDTKLFQTPGGEPEPENELKDAYDINQLVLDEVEEGIYGLDLRGFVTFVNPAAHRMTGWSLDDLKGRTQHSIVHHSHSDGSQYPQEDCPIYQTLRNGVVHHRDNEVFWRKDGTSFPVSYTSTPVPHHGPPCGAVVVFSDITDRVQAQAWQRSRAKIFRSIADREPLGVTLARILEAFKVLVGARSKLSSRT